MTDEKNSPVDDDEEPVEKQADQEEASSNERDPAIDREYAEKKALDEYYEHLRNLIARQQTLASTFDKFVMTIGGALLGISIAALRFIAPVPVPGTEGLIVGCWVLTGIALFLTLASIKSDEKAYDPAIAEMAEEIEKFVSGEEVSPQKNRYEQLTGWLTSVSLLLLIGGFICFALFAYAHLEEPRHGKKEKGTQAATKTAQSQNKKGRKEVRVEDEEAEDQEESRQENGEAEGQEEGRQENIEAEGQEEFSETEEEVKEAA